MLGIVRYPVEVAEGLVFVSEDDLWRVGPAGGVAERIVPMKGRPTELAASPDGQFVAFTSTEEGGRDVFVWSQATGDVRRVTHDGHVLRVAGWRPDGALVYVSSRGRPFARDWRLLAVDPQSGWPAPLLFGPAVAIDWSADGAIVLGRDRTDLSLWRGYRGGRRGHLWLRPALGAPFEVIEHEHSIATPCFVQERMLAVADPEGVPQLVEITQSKVRMLSDHPATHPVRHLRRTGEGVVYVAGPDLYRWNPEEGVQHVPVELRSSRPQRARHFAPAAHYLESVDAHNDGARCVVAVRGKLFVMGWFEGPVHQLGNRHGVRYRLPRWLDGERLLWVTDAHGIARLEVYDDGVTRLLDPLQGGRPVQIRPALDGLASAVRDHRGWLWWVPSDGSEAVAIWQGQRPAISMEVSADSQWLVYAVETGRSGGPSQLRLRSLAPDRTDVALTTGRYRDHSPSFCFDGGLLYFLSYREFDPVYDRQAFDLGFPRGSRPYAIVLPADGPNPFRPGPGPLKPPASKPPKAPVPPQIHVEGIADRVVRFPVAEAVYHTVIGVGGGKVLLTRSGIKGSSQRRMFTPGPGKAEQQLVEWDFDKATATVLNPQVSAIGTSRDRRTMWVRSDERLRTASCHPDRAARDELKKTAGSGRPSGFVNLGRVRLEVDPPAEWAQMFRETAALMRDHHWNPEHVEPDTTPFEDELTRIGGRGELSDLLQRYQGAYGTSHAYEMGGQHKRPPVWLAASLGADIEWDDEAGNAIVRRIVHGEREDPSRRSPLSEPGLQIRPGTRILSVTGVPIRKDEPLDAALVQTAATDIELRVVDPDGQERSVIVRPVRDDRGIRYRDHVITTREHVHDTSNGRLGYVHIPNMGPTGYADFFRDYLVECERDGLVVDVRYNTGGHVSQLLLEKLLRRRVGFVVPRWGEPYSYPAHAVAGSMVAITNAYAGSDGDIFSHLFKRFGLGPLVGTQTWGGTVGIRARHYLVDRSLVTQPEFANWYDDVAFGLENHGTSPDVEVRLPPESDALGEDPQLHAAIRLALEALETSQPVPGPTP